MNAKEMARTLAENAIVLLKNTGSLLPLAPGKTVAFFGRAALETVLSGNGSGAANTEDPSNVLEECRKAGLVPVAAVEDFYRGELARLNADKPQGIDLSALQHMVNSGLMYEFFGKYTPPAAELPLAPALVAEAARQTDTALLVLGRSSGGEECDRHLEDDYYLTQAETALVEQVCSAFAHVAVVLNLNGLIDLSWVERYPALQSLVYLGVCGEMGPQALARILTGQVSPSGKLAVTIARDYQDYPAHRDFSWDKDHPETILTYGDYGLSPENNNSQGFDKSPVTVYREDLYLGYRYFDTFDRTPLFPFGFGLSYTDFSLTPGTARKVPGGVELPVTVANTGSCPGREAVQLYVSAFSTASPRPRQELKAFAKTGLLAPGARETLTLFVPYRELCCFVEASAAYTLEAGDYLLKVGDSSRNTTPAVRLHVPESTVAEQCASRLELRPANRGKIQFLSPSSAPALPPVDCPVLEILPGDVPVVTAPAVPETPADWASFSDQELAALCVGYGPGTPFAAFRETPDPNTVFTPDGAPVTTNSHPTGFNGYVSPAIESKGVRSVFYKDGPAGVGITAWPSESLLACSFDPALLTAFGEAVAQQCRELQVDCWLAPAVNLQRHPLGGRNFEYFSEDPFLAGTLACALAAGVQSGGDVLVCAKHFAVNEQETYRRGSTRFRYDAVDSILTQRAARELYLKPFEMLVKHGALRCIMSSFNRINGTFAGGNPDLCTHILREEWGFDGVVVTDWGDMDTVVDGADAVAAGNDVVMPGGPPVIAQILQGLDEGRLTRAQMETAVGHLFSFLARFGRYDAPTA